MAATASFVLPPTSALGGLRAAAVPRRGFFGFGEDTYDDYLQRHEREVGEYPWSGYVLATLFPYLDEKHGIRLMRSIYDELSTFLTQKRSATHFILSDDHRRAWLAALDAERFSEDALRDYYNEFNASNESTAAQPMLDGIRAIRRSLASVDEKSIILVVIG